MFRLSEVPIKQISEGDFLISATGRLGFIEAIEEEDKFGIPWFRLKWQYIEIPSHVPKNSLNKVFWFGTNEEEARSVHQSLRDKEEE